MSSSPSQTSATGSYDELRASFNTLVQKVSSSLRQTSQFNDFDDISVTFSVQKLLEQVDAADQFLLLNPFEDEAEAAAVAAAVEQAYAMVTSTRLSQITDEFVAGCMLPAAGGGLNDDDRRSLQEPARPGQIEGARKTSTM